MLLDLRHSFSDIVLRIYIFCMPLLWACFGIRSTNVPVINVDFTCITLVIYWNVDSIINAPSQPYDNKRAVMEWMQHCNIREMLLQEADPNVNEQSPLDQPL